MRWSSVDDIQEKNDRVVAVFKQNISISKKSKNSFKSELILKFLKKYFYPENLTLNPSTSLGRGTPIICNTYLMYTPSSSDKNSNFRRGRLRFQVKSSTWNIKFWEAFTPLISIRFNWRYILVYKYISVISLRPIVL